MRQIINIVEYHILLISFTFCQILQSINWQDAIMCVYSFSVSTYPVYIQAPIVRNPVPTSTKKYMYLEHICDPFWHSESDVARAEYLVSPIMP